MIQDLLTRRDFQRVALERLEDAQHLLEAGRWAAAYYLAGYVIECALKARISALTEAESFPPRDTRLHYSHDLDGLLTLAGLDKEFAGAQNESSALRDNWKIVRDWAERSRYFSKGEPQARELVLAVSDPQNGVFVWLQARW